MPGGFTQTWSPGRLSPPGFLLRFASPTRQAGRTNPVLHVQVQETCSPPQICSQFSGDHVPHIPEILSNHFLEELLMKVFFISENIPHEAINY